MQYSQRGAFAETRREQNGNDDRRQNEFGIGIGKQGAQSLIPTNSFRQDCDNVVREAFSQAKQRYGAPPAC